MEKQTFPDHVPVNQDAKSCTFDGEKPRNISSHLWERFKAIEKRTNETTEGSTDQCTQHFQKQAVDMEEHTILMRLTPGLGSNEMLKVTAKRKAEDSSERPSSSKSDALQELSELITASDHLQCTNHSQPPLLTALEMQIEEAIKNRDITTAEVLSDKLATREMGEKIVSALEAKRFLEQKKTEKASTKSRNKRKLHWGFEAKHRWETKGNM